MNDFEQIDPWELTVEDTIAITKSAVKVPGALSVNPIIAAELAHAAVATMRDRWRQKFVLPSTTNEEKVS